jgi:predicted RNA-binding Zn-ribbon protein involved in translation (DUF1610 family)
MTKEPYPICTSCGCHFRPTVSQLTCWDCIDDMIRANNATLEKERVKNALATICKCPLCGRTHIRLERS